MGTLYLPIAFRLVLVVITKRRMDLRQRQARELSVNLVRVPMVRQMALCDFQDFRVRPGYEFIEWLWCCRRQQAESGGIPPDVFVQALTPSSKA